MIQITNGSFLFFIFIEKLSATFFLSFTENALH